MLRSRGAEIERGGALRRTAAAPAPTPDPRPGAHRPRKWRREEWTPGSLGGHRSGPGLRGVHARRAFLAAPRQSEGPRSSRSPAGRGPGGRPAGFRGKGEKRRQRRHLGNFPPQPGFHGNHMLRRRPAAEGEGREFSAPARTAARPAPAGSRARRWRPSRTRRGQLHGDPPWAATGEPGAAMGSRLPWWFSSGTYILVFSLTIGQKLFGKEKPQRGRNAATAASGSG